MKLVLKNDWESDSIVLWESSKGLPRRVKVMTLFVIIYIATVTLGMLTYLHPYKLVLLECTILAMLAYIIHFRQYTPAPDQDGETK